MSRTTQQGDERRERKRDKRTAPESSARDPKAPVSFLDDTWSWTSPSTWPLSVRFLPFPIACTVLFLGVYVQHFLYPISPAQQCMRDFDYRLPMPKIEQLATALATHDWEQGAAAEALLEFYDPELSVFGENPFPDGRIPRDKSVLETKSLKFVLPKILLGSMTLSNNTWGISDPASLGVFATMAAHATQEPGTDSPYMDAVRNQRSVLLSSAPRYANGAISHRIGVAELWSDAVFMFPPFLAYQAVIDREHRLNLHSMRQAVEQIQQYRSILLISEGDTQGAWKHIVGPTDMADPGAWSTGNGWAAYGMARVRATLAGWHPGARFLGSEIGDLDRWMSEIVDAAIRTDDHPDGLLRNYLGDDTWFGETAGTALIAAAAYRLAGFLVAGEERDKYIAWADKKRGAVFDHVDANGVAKPAVNSLKHAQRKPLDGPNPEGESFLLLLAAAWRDCSCSTVSEH